MPVVNVTMTGSAVQLQASDRAMQLVFAPAAHVYYVGDSSTVSATKGIPVPVAGPSVVVGPFTSGALPLKNWYALGTALDVIAFQYTPED